MSFSTDQAYWAISTSTQVSNVGDLLKRTKALYETFQTGVVSAEEVKTAKEYMTGSFPLSTATLYQIASRWLSGKLFHLENDYLEKYLGQVEKVTVDSTQKAIQKYFGGKKLAIVVACDRSVCEKKLKASGFNSIKWLKAEDLK